MTDWKNCGVKDIYIACIDNLKDFAETLESIIRRTEVKLGIVHQIRNARKYIDWKDSKAFMADLKQFCRTRTKELAEANWDTNYPVLIVLWRCNWDLLSVYFVYAPEI